MMRAPRTMQRNPLGMTGKTTIKFIKFIGKVHSRPMLDTKIYFPCQRIGIFLSLILTRSSFSLGHVQWELAIHYLRVYILNKYAQLNSLNLYVSQSRRTILKNSNVCQTCKQKKKMPIFQRSFMKMIGFRQDSISF